MANLGVGAMKDVRAASYRSAIRFSNAQRAVFQNSVTQCTPESAAMRTKMVPQSSEGAWRVWPVGLFELVDFAVGEGDVEGFDGVGEVVGFGGTDDRGGDDRIL